MVTWNNAHCSHIAAAAITAALSVAISPAWVALAEEPADDQASAQMDSTSVSSVGHALSSDVNSEFSVTSTPTDVDSGASALPSGEVSSENTNAGNDLAKRQNILDARSQGTSSNDAEIVAKPSTASVEQPVPSVENDGQNESRTLAEVAADNRDGAIVKTGTYVIRNRGMALDVSGGSGADGANVQLWQENGTAAQEWNVTVDADGYVTLKNVKSGKALDVCGASGKPGANVQQYSPNGTAAQRWVVEKNNGALRLRSALGLDLVLDVWAGSRANGANVQLYTANGTAAQTWEFVRQEVGDIAARNVNGEILPSDTYVLQGSDSGVVLEIGGGSTANGANAQVWRANGSGAQAWRTSIDELGYITLVNARSGKALDVSCGNARRGQNVDQYDPNGTGAQKWIAEKKGDAIVLHSALNYGLVLDVSGANMSNGTNVALWDANDTKAQSWHVWRAYPEVAATGRSVMDGVYAVRSVKSGRVVDVSGGSLVDCASVGTYTANGTGAQAWRIKLDDDGFYEIRNAQSGRCLDVVDRVVIPGASIQQWGLNGQRWNIVTDSVGKTFRIVSEVSGLALAVKPDGSLTTAKVDLLDESQLFDLSEAVLPTLADGWKAIAAFGTGKVLDVPGGSTKAGVTVQTYSPNGSRAQSWWTRRQKDGSYTLQASNSGLYLTEENGAKMEKDAGASSRWNLDWGETGGYVLKNALSGVQMTVGNVVSWLFSTATSGVKAGFYEIASALDQTKRLDVAGGSKGAGSNVQSYASNGSLAQRYWIRSAGGDSFTITNCNSDLNLDVSGAGTADGTNVQQYYRSSSSAQRFRFTMGESGLEIRSVLGDGVLDISGASKSNGANVQIWHSNGTAAQSWVLIEAAAPAKMGWQNPSWMYQVSWYNVPSSPYASGIFRYMSPSSVGIEDTRDQVINAFVRRAYDYLGTPYRWNYACAPGVGVDCVGLVMQCAYACGMNLGLGTGAYDFNPYAHYATGNNGWHSHDANNFWNGGKGVHLGIGARQKGDLISWNGHIAIYIGGDRIIEAPGFGQNVRISSVWAYGTPRGVIRIFG